MQLVNKTRWYRFDEDAYTRFLDERGFQRDEVTNLKVILHYQPPVGLRKREAERSCLIYGYYLNYEIYLFPHGSGADKINATLVHETSHYWDAVQAERELIAAASSLEREAYHRYVRAWNRWRWSDAFFDEGEARAQQYEQHYSIEVIERCLPSHF